MFDLPFPVRVLFLTAEKREGKDWVTRFTLTFVKIIALSKSMYLDYLMDLNVAVRKCVYTDLHFHMSAFFQCLVQGPTLRMHSVKHSICWNKYMRKSKEYISEWIPGFSTHSILLQCWVTLQNFFLDNIFCTWFIKIGILDCSLLRKQRFLHLLLLPKRWLVCNCL